MFGFSLGPLFKKNIGGGGFDSDAQAFINRGTFSDPQKDIINQFVLNLKTGLVNGNNLWIDVLTGYALYPIIGGTAANHSLNLMGTSFPITWINSPIHSSTGVLFNGTTQYGKTGIIPSIHLIDRNLTITGYLKNTMGATESIFGAHNSNSQRLQLFPRVGGNMVLNIYGGSGGVLSKTNISAAGLGTATVRNIIDAELWSENVSLGTQITTSTLVPTVEMYFGGNNNGGTPNFFLGNEVRIGGVYKGMTTSQFQDWHAANLAFQTALSRNI